MKPPFDIKQLRHALADGDDLRRGSFITREAPGAYPNGTRVRKAMTEPGDPHELEDLATVVGSVGPLPEGKDTPPHLVGTFGYFVCWDDMPQGIVFVAGVKLAAAE